MRKLCVLAALCTLAAVTLQGRTAPAARALRPALSPALPAARPISAPPGQTLLVPFTLTRGSPTFACAFTAPAAATYTAAANWESRSEIKVTVTPSSTGRQSVKTGPPPQGCAFQAQAAEKCIITVGPVQGFTAAKGELAVLVGAGETARKRMPPSPDLMANALSRMEHKDALLPLIVRLMDRHLQNAPGKNELDREFQRALAQHPRVSRDMLSKFVNDFNAIPTSVKQRAFVAESLRAPRLTPVTAGVLRSAMLKAHPKLSVSAQPSAARQLQPVPVPPGVIQPPEPAITDITPANMEPGKAISIQGQDFVPGKPHKVRWSRRDQDGIESALASDCQAQTSTLIRTDVPWIALPGTWEVTVRVTDENPRTSPPYLYQVATPQYRVTFDQMKCLDESNPEWWGSDEIVTFWATVADDQVWSKNTGEYGGFDDGDVKSYRSADRRVFPPDASYGPVKHGLVIVTKLYEWDAGDVSAVQDFIGLLGDIGAGLSLASGVGTPAMAAVIEAVAWFLGEMIGVIASWFGGDPDYLGTQELSWTSNHLQQTLTSGSSRSRTIEFRNSGDTGSYRLYYTISRH